MADLTFYQQRYGISDEEQAFAKFIATIQNYYDADYYVNWTKVFQNTKKYEREFALLSTLTDKPDKEQAARELLLDYPQIIPALPYLIACRKNVTIVEDAFQSKVTTYEFKSAALLCTEVEAEYYARFLMASGLIELLGHIHNVGDYATGIEVGMDTNARKNRGGDCGVRAIDLWIENAQIAMPTLRVKREANYEFLLGQGCDLSKSFSAVVWDRAFWLTDHPGKFVVMETNHYGGGGSKLGAIAREYTGREKCLVQDGIGFIWVTDGLGWKSARKALREAFKDIPFIVNVQLASEGQLEAALRSMLISP